MNLEVIAIILETIAFFLVTLDLYGERTLKKIKIFIRNKFFPNSNSALKLDTFLNGKIFSKIIFITFFISTLGFIIFFSMALNAGEDSPYWLYAPYSLSILAFLFVVILILLILASISDFTFWLLNKYGKDNDRMYLLILGVIFFLASKFIFLRLAILN